MRLLAWPLRLCVKNGPHVAGTVKDAENLQRLRVCSVDDHVRANRPETDGLVGEVLSEMPDTRHRRQAPHRVSQFGANLSGSLAASLADEI